MSSKFSFALFLPLLLIGCVDSGAQFSAPEVQKDSSTVLDPVNSPSTPITQPTILPSSPPVSQRNFQTDALLYSGQGVWAAEVESLKGILSSHGSTFKEVSSAELNGMTVDELLDYGMLIIPGGSGGTIAKSLTSDTRGRLREAVQQRGLGYIGFCAGAFVAQAPAPRAGQDVSYGIGVVDGPELDYYYLENKGTDIAMTLETFADGSKRDLVWYGGPVTPNLPGGVIAKYPNGDPAITEMWSGKGFVILSGPHPAAPQSTRNSFGLQDSDGLDLDLAWTLMGAVLHQKPLQSF